jgi:phosphate transport system permease protein
MPPHAAAPDAAVARSRPRVRAETSPARLAADRAARWLVTAGGCAIIAGVLGIFAFMLAEVLPLASGASVVPAGGVLDAGPRPVALLTDEHRAVAAALGADGVLRVVGLEGGAVVVNRDIASGARPIAAAAAGDHLAAALDDGRVVAVPVRWEVRFEEGRRVVAPAVGDTVFFPMDPEGRPLGAFAVRLREDGGGAAAAQLASGRLVVSARRVTENLVTGARSETTSRFDAGAVRSLSAMVLDAEARNLYAGTEGGTLLWWRLRDGRPAGPAEVSAGSAPVTALALLLGDRSLVAGSADGSLHVWSAARGADGAERLARFRGFPALPEAVRLIAPSRRGKGFLAADAGGAMGLHYSTSGRTLWRGTSPAGEPSALAFAPKGDGALVAGARGLAALSIHNPHPEASFEALFAKVWYEGYGRPEHVWQSSGGTDDFEPKLGLVPLLAGTLKGTFYSLVLAVPLAVLGAMYTSQFMHPDLKRIVKPAVEIMAALPSVVLGFLAGLWLAPRVERVFPALLLAPLVLPAGVLAAGLLRRRLPARALRRLPPGSEVVLYAAALAACGWVCLAAARPLEDLAFGGDFRTWLLDVFGLAYDQRNAVVVGLAMGFAVIPIIFAISEDAFSNVPANLPAGSLALGATRWQTVTRLVLPTASPGIFSAVMVGFGRAVGETMIVVMATGNTPILDWNPFNGFRTLSANIVVEIPEAPHGGTLYRTLFLAALLLFTLTFIVNTAAEMIRQNLRRRYAEL